MTNWPCLSLEPNTDQLLCWSMVNLHNVRWPYNHSKQEYFLMVQFLYWSYTNQRTEKRDLAVSRVDNLYSVTFL